MKRFLYSYIAAACLLATACTPQGGDTAASLDVSPTSLAFGAEDATTQTVDVTATGGVEWKHIVPSSADWITVDDKTPGKLTVSVSRNPNAEKRTASITIKPTNNDDVKTKSVTVTQQGNENPEVYSLAIDPDTALTFAAEGAPAQTVKVTATGEGIAWSAAVEDAAKEWITLSATEGGEGETSLAITVKDNPDTAQRTANITLTTNNATITPKAIRVTQEAKVLPASFSMTYNGEELPEEGLVSDYRSGASHTINVAPVNVTWDVKTKYESGGNNWLEVRKYESDNVCLITVNFNSRNESPETRTALLTVTTDAEGIGPFEIPLTQKGKPSYLSTIEEDVEMALTHCYALVAPNNDYRDEPSTLWDLRLWSEGITYDESNYPDYFTGTGEKLAVYFYSEPLTLNDDGEYYLPDGTYTVTAYGDGSTPFAAGMIRGGGETWNYVFPQGSWYSRIEETQFTGHALLSEGTATVTRNGEVYTITFDFTSDAQCRVTGTFQGEFDLRVQA